MNASLFDYHLPPERIAQEPMRPRDHSRLLVLNRKTGAMEHKHFYDILEYLHEGDLLVVNETKVFNARLKGTIESKREIEVFLLHANKGTIWTALAKPAKKLKEGSVILFDASVSGIVRAKNEDGTICIEMNKSPEEIIKWTESVGSIPIPPYISTKPADQKDYQTVYAKHTGSVAAPTAGFHFTDELMKRIKEKGIQFAYVTLHVGMGTFKPLQTETVEEHIMHKEWISIPEETKKRIEQTKKNKKRVIAVGTTTVRALESEIDQGFTNIFIKPGHVFKTVDAMITNFHLPKSTLIILISAFAGEGKTDLDEGRKMILSAYQNAIENEYRFYSFGDAMFIA